MKSLKDCIKNYMYESVWDIEDNIEDDNKEFILQEIKKFIKDNYGRINMDRCKIIFDEKKNKYIINFCKKHYSKCQPDDHLVWQAHIDNT